MPNRSYSTQRLRSVLENKFTLEELGILCTDLQQHYPFAKYDFLPGDSLPPKANALVQRFHDHGKLDALAEEIQKLRPFIDIVAGAETVKFQKLDRVKTLHVVAVSWPAGVDAPGAPRPADAAADSLRRQHPEVVCEVRGNTLLLASETAKAAELLRMALVPAPAGALPFRLGVHAEEVYVESDDGAASDIPLHCQEVTRRVAALGEVGHVVASESGARALREDADFADKVHPLGESDIPCPEVGVVHNVYDERWGRRELTLRRPSRRARLVRRLSRYKGLIIGMDADAPVWPLRRACIPPRINTERPGKIWLQFCPLIPRVVVDFSEIPDLRFTADEELRRRGVVTQDDNQFVCSLTGRERAGGWVLFRAGVENFERESNRFVVAACRDDDGRMLAPPVEAWTKLYRRPAPLRWLYRLLYWLDDLSKPFKWLLAVAALAAVLVAIPWGRVLHATAHVYESLMILAHVPGYPPRYLPEDGATDEFKPADGPLADRWDFPAGAWNLGLGVEADDEDQALWITGQGFGAQKQLRDAAVYDFRFESRAGFSKSDRLAWVFRLQPDPGGLSGYVFELVRLRDNFRLDTYVYESGRPRRLGSKEVNVVGCCIEGDTIEIEANVDRYTFDYIFRLQGGGDRPDVGQDHPVSVTIREGPYYRHGGVGLLGTSPVSEGQTPRTSLEYFRVYPELTYWDF